MFVDSAHIHVVSGKGGDGCVSFRREKYVPRGGPDGGDGGDGGSVVLVADHNIETLLDFSGRHHWKAAKGRPGMPKDMHGANGDDAILRLPPGTQVYNEETGELVADLAEHGTRLVVAAGGKGGRGNASFATATHQVPHEFTPGEPAIELDLRLELKLIADVGLVGLPNAGKSTLLSTVTAATPKIADYPFTTLTPQLGIAAIDNERRLVIADIPGLIEHASQGAGLGSRFLRHVERTRLLVHLVDIDPADGSDPVANYRTIRGELAAHSAELAAKPELIALSKTDLLTDADRQAAVDLLAAELGRPVIPISSAARRGLDALLDACWAQLGDSREDRFAWTAETDHPA
ncbi:MAG: GTPase ObgE [Planctomycetota bacterium]